MCHLRVKNYATAEQARKSGKFFRIHSETNEGKSYQNASDG